MVDASIMSATPADDPKRGSIVFFVVGSTLWLATLAVTFMTNSVYLMPTLILMGAFLAPATCVVYAYERRASGALSERTIFVGFALGGILGILSASVLESWFLRQHPPLTGVWVGMIEEASKLGALAVVVWRPGVRVLDRGIRFAFNDPSIRAPVGTVLVGGIRDGIVLGGTVGFGFAALESSGYGLSSLFSAQGVSLNGLVQVQLLRAVLTPVGHGIWTGILGGILLRGRGGSGPGLSWSLVGGYLAVSLLHGLWDSSQSIGALTALLATGGSLRGQDVQNGNVPLGATVLQARLYTLVSWTVVGLSALMGAGALRQFWRRAAVTE
jgi:RsiW-degrading membrane proteinase PrsW (M82 family)